MYSVGVGHQGRDVVMDMGGEVLEAQLAAHKTVDVDE